MSHRLPRRALLIVDVEPAFLTPITKHIVRALKYALEGRTVIRVVKSTRSLFGSDALLATKLRCRGIQEVHIAGLETHDCVLATAFDAFDHGFRTFVLADVCASKQVGLHRAVAGRIVADEAGNWIRHH